MKRLAIIVSYVLQREATVDRENAAQSLSVRGGQDSMGLDVHWCCGGARGAIARLIVWVGWCSWQSVSYRSLTRCLLCYFGVTPGSYFIFTTPPRTIDERSYLRPMSRVARILHRGRSTR